MRNTIFKEIEKLKKKQAQNRYWRFRNAVRLREYELKRYPKRKEYILALNKKRESNKFTACRTGTILHDGYLYVCNPHHPHATKKGFVLQHRLNMELKIGRYLLSSEVVHHKDKNTLNNHISNLELLEDQAAHNLRHEKMRDKLGRFIPGGTVQ